MTEIDETRIIPTEDIQLQVFLMQIADQITDEELKTLKFLLSGNGGMGKSMREQITNVLDLFYHLKELRLLSPNNLVTLQALIWHLGRKDLYRKFVDFCKTHPSTLHFYAPSETPVNGFRYVHFHLRGTDACSRDKIQRLRNQISFLLCCPIDYIIPDGIVPTGSVYVTFMIPEWCIDVLMKIRQEDKARLNSFGVDRFKIDNDYVDCKEFQEGDERPDMDKDTAVDKIMQENKQLATDLEHFQVSYYNSKRALKEMKSQYDDAMQKANLTRSEVEELKEHVADLSERPISQKNLHDLEQMSSFIQANLIELLNTRNACKITAKIMSGVQLYRQDSVDLKRHIHTLVGNQVFDEVYKEVEDLRIISNAITFQQARVG